MVTDHDIRQLQDEAGWAHDFVTVALCEWALDGTITDPRISVTDHTTARTLGQSRGGARALCAQMIRDAALQDDWRR